MNKFTITVPASSANIGSGFDSAGMAINRYLTLHVQEDKKWEFVHDSRFLPSNINYENHFIYKVAKQVSERHDIFLPTSRVIVNSEIPLARGLGSSASAVIAGIELANQLCNLSLTSNQKLAYATEIEGHPDNVAPALLGGLVISAISEDKEIDYIQVEELDLDIVLYIPDTELRTEDARKVLPDSYPRDIATSASGISSIMVASLITKNYELAGKMMEQDLFHESYRAKLIPNYHMIREEAKELGAYGTVISGAGPTMISFVPKGQGQEIEKEMQDKLTNYDVASLKVDYTGLQVT